MGEEEEGKEEEGEEEEYPVAVGRQRLKFRCNICI
jgi:hypothetical protein